MEYLNKVQLRGWVGNSRIFNGPSVKVNRFSLATDYSYKDKDGSPIIETTWHQCLVWSNPNRPDIETIVKGAKVEVQGRIRTGKYTNSDGVETAYFEILVQDFKVIND